MKRTKKLKTTGGGVQYGAHTCFFATLNKEQKSSYLQLCRRLNGKMLVFGFLYSKSTPIVLKKSGKPTCQTIVFSQNTNKHKYARKSPVLGHDPKFLFPLRYRIVPSVYDKNTSRWSLNAQI